MIDYFDGTENDFLSNFYLCPNGVTVCGLTFPTSEHAFMWFKTTNLNDANKIITAPTPGAAKRIGRQVQLRSDWEEIKVAAMMVAVSSKFNQNPDLAQRLLDTGDQELIEGNHWHDNIWGNCICEQCKDKQGENLLGQILMLVRKGLKQT